MKGKLRGLAVAVLVLPASCALFSAEASLSVTLPQVPGHWQRAFPALRWTVSFVDQQGREVAVDAGDGSRPVRISCPRLPNAPVMAYPRAGTGQERDAAGDLLKPAGALYPWSLDPGKSSTLAASWEEGPVACVVTRLVSLGRDVSLLNTRRLCSLLSRFPDPWSLGLDAIATLLALGQFSARDASPRAARDVLVMAGPGEWFLESPFAAVATAAPDGSVLLADISLGLHGLFASDGSCLLLQVNEQDACLLAPSVRSDGRPAAAAPRPPP